MPKVILTLLALPPEGSTIAKRIDALHVFVISITLVSSFVVALLAAWFVVRYKRKSDGELTPRVTASWPGEIALIGGILSLFLVWWVIGFRQYVDIESPPADKDAMVVYVQAKQWMWKFTYEDGTSANDTLTVPVGRPVRLVMTSRDVIHSFYVPAFRTKQDVLPGRVITTWFEAAAPGDYPIFCAEYCGTSHSSMRGLVRALAPEDYAAWLASTSRDRSGERDLARAGEAVAVRRECVACHVQRGPQALVGPSWVGLYGSTVTLADGRHVLADEAYLTRSMMEPAVDVVAGFKPVMPSYRGVLGEGEAAALVEYIKTLRESPSPGVTLPQIDVIPVADGGAP